MATYKLMQDIEAEDKILGPLTLRQFVFALVTAFLGYMSFLAIGSGFYFLLAITVPPFLLAGFFAFPFGRDQPTEIWALAKIRFLFKPRTRLWDQSGVKELVTITVPKKIERVYTDGLSKTEVQSRLKALANTIDSRGWAVKNVNLTSYTPNPMAEVNTDRLIDMSNVPQAVPDAQVSASDDILDEQNNRIAQQFDSMISQSNTSHRRQLVDQMNSPASTGAAATSDPWFMGNNGSASAGEVTAEEAALLARSHAENDARQVTYGHLHTLRPQSMQQPATSQAPGQLPATTSPLSVDAGIPSAAPMTDQPDPAILSLATNNDLDVATLARQAQKAKDDESRSDEVIVSLR